MAEYDEEGVDVAAAAQILLSLRNRKLRRWPEWEAEDFDLSPVPEGWPKGRRSPLLVRASGAAWLKSLKDPFAQLGHRGSGASSSGEDRAWSPVPVRDKAKAARRAEMLPCYGAAAVSGPSTSGVDRARPRPRSEKARAKVAAVKEVSAMAASSPETPFDYGIAAGSGASSSGDERLRSSPTKRKARRQSGSGGPSSGDEGCSSPAKRTRPDLNAGDGVTQAAAPAAVKVEEPPKIDEENCRDEMGYLLFDLNEDINMSWEG